MLYKRQVKSNKQIKKAKHWWKHDALNRWVLCFVFKVGRPTVFPMLRGSEFQSLGTKQLTVLQPLVLRRAESSVERMLISTGRMVLQCGPN